MKQFYYFCEKVSYLDKNQEIPYIGYSFNCNQDKAKEMIESIGLDFVKIMKRE